MTTIAAMYRDAAAYVRACTGLFLLVVAAELAQHLIEYRAGFYDSLAAMKAAEGDVARMAMGHVKVLLLFATNFFALRFYAFGRDPAAPLRRDPRAWALFVPVMLWGLFWLVLLQDGAWAARAMGWSGRPFALALVVVMLLSTGFEIALSAWKTAAASGNGAIGFVRSIRLTRGHVWWSLTVSAAAILPAMVLHYGFAFLSLGRGPLGTAAVLVADSLLVGIMGPLMAAATYAIARRVTQGAEVPLVPVPLAPAH